MSSKIQEEGSGNGRATSEHAGRSRVSAQTSPGTGRFLGLMVILLLAVLAIGFVIAYGVHRHTEDAAQQLVQNTSNVKPIVVVVAARTASRNYPLTLPGQTAGWYQSTIFARVDGYVASWSADIGDRVKRGQVLALIETPDLDQQLNAAKAKVATADAQVTVAQSTVSIAKLTWERWRDSPKGVVSEQEREDKNAAYDEAVANLTAAQAQAKADQADVDRLLALEGFKQVTAPYDGVITSRKIDVGDLVSAGSSSSTTPLYSMAQSNVIRVFTEVPQKAASEMAVGLSADVTSDQYPGRDFQGEIARSAMSIDPQTRTQKTEVDIKNADMALVPGMYVEVSFNLNQRGLQEVPAAAIMFVPSGLQVAVIDDDNKVEFRPVKVAKDNGDTVVLASGVNAGDKVALNLSTAIRSGEEVDPQLDPSSDVWPAKEGPAPAQTPAVARNK